MTIELFKASVCAESVEMFADISFRASSGDIVAITGGSSVGRTALLRSLLGMQRLSSGWACMDGEPLLPSTAPYFRRFMSLLPADFCFGHIGVADVADCIRRLKANKDHTFNKDDIIREFSLLKVPADTYYKDFMELDKSVAQRVALALSVNMGHPVVLLDSPTSVQDEEGCDIVASYLSQSRFQDAAMIIATEAPALLGICNKIVQLSDMSNLHCNN